MTQLAMLITPPSVAGPAEGIVAWPELATLAFWFLLMAFVGSLLGLLHERRRESEDASPPVSAEPDEPVDGSLGEAA